MSVSRETTQLGGFAALIRKWNPTINLVSPATLGDLETRHICDSVQLAAAASTSCGTWADLGSGGGLPGVVMAILRTDLEVILVESDQRKCSFLRSAARELDLKNVRILNDRIEYAQPLNVENISARALAPLPLLLSYVQRHLKHNGTAWLMKGRNWHSEVEEARISWKFDLITHQSRTDPDSVILEMTSVRYG